MLIISPEQRAQIGSHAERIYPEECCGLLIGTVEGEEKIVTEVHEAENNWGNDAAAAFSEIAGSKRNRFSIDPKVLLKAQKESRQRHLGIIGIYHSHPDAPAIPSEFDRRIAWSGYSYLIVSVCQGSAVELRSWTLDPAHQFQPEAISLNILELPR